MNRRVISKEHNLSSSENNTQKKNQACTRFEPMASVILVQCSMSCTLLTKVKYLFVIEL